MSCVGTRERGKQALRGQESFEASEEKAMQVWGGLYVEGKGGRGKGKGGRGRGKAKKGAEKGSQLSTH